MKNARELQKKFMMKKLREFESAQVKTRVTQHQNRSKPRPGANFFWFQQLRVQAVRFGS